MPWRAGESDEKSVAMLGWVQDEEATAAAKRVPLEASASMAGVVGSGQP
jgi:hypothetical protein